MNEYNLLEESFTAMFLDIYRDVLIYNSLKHKMLTREYELSFKPKLKDFFTQLKLTRNKEMIDEIISVFSLSKFQINKDTENILSQMILFNNEHSIIIKMLYPDAVDIFKQNDPIIYETLKIRYLESFDSFSKAGKLELLNKSFLLHYKIFIIRLYPEHINQNDISTIDDYLIHIINTYLRIIVDDKSFDEVILLESMLFKQNFELNRIYLKNELEMDNINIFFNAAKCYYYLNQKLTGEKILNEIFHYMDDVVGEEKNEIHDYISEINANITGYYISKFERKEIFEKYDNLKPNWTFSTIIQSENAFRLDLIGKDKMEKLRTRFSKVQALEDQFHILVNEPFLKLEVDNELYGLPIFETNASMIYHGFNLELPEQKIEYYNTFYVSPKLNKVRKYLQLRLDRFYIEIVKFGKFDYVPMALKEFELFEKIGKSVIYNGGSKDYCNYYTRLNRILEIGKNDFLERLAKSGLQNSNEHLQILQFRFDDTL